MNCQFNHRRRRFEIFLALSYLQQGLGSLMKSSSVPEPNIDKSVQTVSYLFDMSSKALDQIGRSGAYHHIIRHEAVVADTGLDTLKDIHVKVLDLPLRQGVFGQGLEDKLKDRKEKKDQLSDLVPELFYNKKRSWSGSYEKQNKRQKTSTFVNKSSTSASNFKSGYNRTSVSTFQPKKPYNKEKSEPAVPPFRIPKKK